MTDQLTLVQYRPQAAQFSQAFAKKLQDTGFLTVSPDADGLWQVTAGRHVGTLSLDGLRVFIKPKIRMENLFLLLSVGVKEKDWTNSAVRYATSNELLSAVISFFTRQVDLTLARGVHRSYKKTKDRLYTMRGRIDIPTQITRGGVVHPVDCRFGEFTADVVENRYLKAGVRRALLVPGIRHEDRRRLHRILVTLEEVTDVMVRPELLETIGFHRVNSHYEPSLRLARLILENLTLDDNPGGTSASSFMVDMSALFERFVTDRLQRALRGRIETRSQYGTRLDRAGRVRIRPDLVFRRLGDIAFVGDLKYKVVDERWDVPSADQYQLLAYTTALNLPEGVLIYCRDPDSVGLQHDAVTVRHSKKVLHAWGVDMSGPTIEVEAEIRTLAEWIAERAHRANPLVIPVAS